MLSRQTRPAVIVRCAAQAALALAAIAAASAASALSPGQTAPALALHQADGIEWKLADQRGRVVLVDFWASWCGPCREAFPALEALHRRFADQGLVVVGVNLDEERKEAERFLKVVPVNFTIVFDSAGASAHAFALPGMPSSYLLGRDGKVRAVHQGFRAHDGEKLAAEIEAALAVAAP
jgi:thiol-disulfide isomerase/thioredoxin